MAKTRLDQLLVERHLAPSRERARALILSGHVTVGGQVVAKAGAAVSLDAQVQLAVPDHPYVGRGGLTGGFTDVLLQRGAGSVIALDVGRGQLDWSLRNDPRVTVREGVNARALGREHIPHEVDLVTIDVAFISLRHIFPALPSVLAPAADVVALVKPQFEAGRDQVGRGGVVRDPAVHDEVIDAVTRAASASRFERIGLTRSPITGATGNIEFLLHLRHLVIRPARD